MSRKAKTEIPVQIFLLGWTGVLDCHDVLFGMFHSSQHPPQGLSPMFYKNEKVDRLLDQASRELGDARRKEFYREVQTIVWQDAPWVFLWTQKWYLATVRNLQGVSIRPIEMWDAIYATWK